MPDTIPCPQYGAPAQITERFWLDSTDGPVEHLKTGCPSKHWFTPRAETVQSEQVATPDRDLAVLPSGLDGLDLVLPVAHRAAPEFGTGAGWLEVTPMCLRCGVVEYPYWSWPSRPAGPGDYGSPPDASPPEYGAAPTGGLFGIGARGRDYRMTTGRWDRGRAVGGNILTRLRVIR